MELHWAADEEYRSQGLPLRQAQHSRRDSAIHTVALIQPRSLLFRAARNGSRFPVRAPRGARSAAFTILVIGRSRSVGAATRLRDRRRTLSRPLPARAASTRRVPNARNQQGTCRMPGHSMARHVGCISLSRPRGADPDLDELRPSDKNRAAARSSPTNFRCSARTGRWPRLSPSGRRGDASSVAVIIHGSLQRGLAGRERVVAAIELRGVRYDRGVLGADSPGTPWARYDIWIPLAQQPVVKHSRVPWPIARRGRPWLKCSADEAERHWHSVLDVCDSRPSTLLAEKARWWGTDPSCAIDARVRLCR